MRLALSLLLLVPLWAMLGLLATADTGLEWWFGALAGAAVGVALACWWYAAKAARVKSGTLIRGNARP
jgi:hypothetical protein